MTVDFSDYMTEGSITHQVLAKALVSKDSSKVFFIVAIFFLFSYAPLFLPVLIKSIWVIPSLRIV
jgi:hypothetical protein